ncbi:MAG TPA: TlpA disulfide reductase family protein [Candidatus Aquilonibacter sp.]|nr:TlpA disulfide reductase family protein [Candidatus Aquilonibacter sp.]
MDEQKRRRWLTPGRFLDAIAILVIAFVAWKLLIAPRQLKGGDAYPAPQVSFQKLDGGTFHVADARGRVLFLDFFASWCDPCKLESPLVEQYARKHPDVLVVPVDVGEPRMLAERFAKKYGLQHVVLDPKSSSQGFFQIQGFPTIVVIDPRGKIRASWSGFNPAIQMAMANAAKTLR